MRLEDLNIGESKIIKKILDNKLTLRFIEMGIFPGEKVKIVLRGNNGCPGLVSFPLIAGPIGRK